MATASELLEQAKTMYSLTYVNHREGLLACGRLLHSFVLEHIRQGDGMEENRRIEAGFTRRCAVNIAAESFGVTHRKINNLIGAAAVADLIIPGVDFRDIGWHILMPFCRFVQRKVAGRRTHYTASGVKASDCEQWEVKAKFAESAAALLRLAISTPFTQECSRSQCMALFHGKKKRHVYRSPKTQAAVEEVGRSVARASPGDVAELCLDIISKSEDPAAVAIRLRVMLERFLPKKAKAMQPSF